MKEEERIKLIENCSCMETLQVIVDDSDEHPACRALAGRQMMFLQQRELGMRNIIFSNIKWIVYPVIALAIGLLVLGYLSDTMYYDLVRFLNG